MLSEEELRELDFGRNPFLSRAGFDKRNNKRKRRGSLNGRNPFLSRAGFDPKSS